MKKTLLKLGWFIAVSLPIVIFLHSIVFNTRGILYGDWDYFAQVYEAARRSILEFHQFPWLNPWIAGGVPLYANPQFGLVSIQMPLVLLFGTLAGLHLAILCYFLIGFWGMYLLLKRLQTDKVIRILLSYTWVFSGFTAWRIAGGHLTFATYLLAPLFFYFLLNIRKRYGWLWFGLYVSFLINQNMHYMTVHMLLIGLAVTIFLLFIHRKQVNSFWLLVKPFVFSTLVILPLIAHKLYYTLQFAHDFTRVPPSEVQTPINIITAALTFRGKLVLDPSSLYRGGFGWAEYAAYFGILTLALFAYIVIKNLEKPRSLKPAQKFVLAGLFVVLLLAIGNFSPISPYGLMGRLPIFNQMQVSARWLGWFAFGVIVYLYQLPRKTIIVTLLVLSVLDVFQANIGIINYNFGSYQEPVRKSDRFEQLAYPTTKSGKVDLTSLRLLYATQANRGDIYGYEPVFGFGIYQNEGYSALTDRCAANRTGCSFVITNNAKIIRWSPNKIELQRTESGDIEINMNPGSYWLVNGNRIFKGMDILELKQRFLIKDSSSKITIVVQP